MLIFYLWTSMICTYLTSDCIPAANRKHELADNIQHSIFYVQLIDEWKRNADLSTMVCFQSINLGLPQQLTLSQPMHKQMHVIAGLCFTHIYPMVP